MENIFNGKTKFWKVDIKTRTLNFQVNHEKPINEILKSLKSANSLNIKQYKKLEQLDLDLVFYMAFIKFTKQFSMLVHLSDLYCIQFGHQLIKLLSF